MNLQEIDPIMQLITSSFKLGPPLDLISEKQASFQLRSELVNIIKIYFDFTYYLCATPFRLVKGNNGVYYQHTWKPQQVICSLLNLLCIFRLLASIREAIPDGHTRSSRILKNPIPYFEMVLAFCSFFFKTIMIKRFWLDGHLYLKIVNSILKEHYLPVSNKWVTKPTFLYALFGFNAIKVLVCLISGYTFVVPIGNWSPSYWFRMLVVHGRFVFGFNSVDSLKNIPDYFEEITVTDGIFAGLMLLAYYSRNVMAEFCDLCILIFALTLWTPANSFAENINQLIKLDNMDMMSNDKDHPPKSDKSFPIPGLQKVDVYNSNGRSQYQQSKQQTWSKIYANFQAIQSLSEVVNISMGSLLTWYLAEGLMYYSIHMNIVFVTSDMFQRYLKLGYFLVTCLTLYISADFCNEMEAAKSWLVKKDNIKAVPLEEAYLVLHEVVTKDIGMRGSDYFTVTFELVAEYLGLIITFFIICVQESELKE